MIEKSKPDNDLPDTPSLAEFPIGSPESRAAARRLLEAGSIRHIKSFYVEAGERDSEGRMIGPPRECDPVRAKVEGGGLPDAIYTRLESETAAQFEARVWDDLPVAGPRRVVSMYPRDDSPDHAA